MTSAQPSKFLVCHDYGMGGVWWWIIARSAEDIRIRVADVVVVTDPAWFDRVASWNIRTIDLDSDEYDDSALRSLVDQRTRQRQSPYFGRLAGRSRVWVRMPDHEGEVWTFELDADGCDVRHVVSNGEKHVGSAFSEGRRGRFDLYDPDFEGTEITGDEFEQLWMKAIG